MTFEFPIRAYVSLAVGVVVLLAACSRQDSTAGSSGLKPIIDESALQTMVDTTARELLIPGAVVFLRTPQGTIEEMIAVVADIRETAIQLVNKLHPPPSQVL